MGNVPFLSANMPAARVWCYMFVFYCEVKQLNAAEQGGVELQPIKGCLTRNVCFSCRIISVWVPKGQEHILIPLSEPMIQTHRGTTPTPLLFSVETEATGVT